MVDLERGLGRARLPAEPRISKDRLGRSLALPDYAGAESNSCER